MGALSTRKCVRKFIWLDSNINNEYNLNTYNRLFKKNNVKCQKFEKIDDCLDYIKKEDFNENNNNNNENNNNNNDNNNNNNGNDEKYKNVVIIVSGKLYMDFFFEFKKIIEKIKFSPTIIVYLRNKDFFINKLKLNNIYYNDDLFDQRLIFDKEDELEEYLKKECINTKELSFELIYDSKQLIIPYYYSCLFEDVTPSEIYFFNEYLKQKYENKNKDIYKYVCQIKNKKLPKTILCKYWLRIYSLESDFYGDMNKDLRNLNLNIFAYFPFIKMCYEGIKKSFLESVVNQELYRGSVLSKEEFTNLENLLKKQDNAGFPKVIVYSRSFLSFSKNKNTAEGFIGKKDNKDLIKILFIIDKNENKKIDKNRFSNADISEFSRYGSEEEVLVFPLSCFIISRIESENYYKKIFLEYLGSCEKFIKKDLKNNINDITITDFTNLLIETGVVAHDSIVPIWIEKGKLNLKEINICFILDNGKDLLAYQGNNILIIDLNETIKLKKRVHDDEILSIIKLIERKICSISKDKTIKISEIFDKNIKIIKTININENENYSKIMLYLKNDNNVIFIKNNSYIIFYDLEKYEYKDNNIFEEKETIINMKELSDGRFIYITQDKNHKNFLKFSDKSKSYYLDTEKELLKNQNMISYKNYFLMANVNQIGNVNFSKEYQKIKFMFDLKFQITNIINITFNKFILGLYDSEKNESIIREFIINETENGEINFECIGEGRFEKIIIENIIIINESKILARTTNGKYIIIQKYSKLKEIFEYKKILKEEEKEINNKNQNDKPFNKEKINKEEEAVNEKQKEININNINNEIKKEKEYNLKEEEKNIKEDKDKIIIKEEKEIKSEKKEIKNKDKTYNKKNEEDISNDEEIMILNNNKKQHNKEDSILKLKINNINKNEKENKGTNKKFIKKASKSYDEAKAIKNAYTYNKEKNIIEEKNKELYKLESEIEKLTEKLTNRLISDAYEDEDEEKKIRKKLNEKKAEKEVLLTEIFISELPPANKETILKSISIKEKHKNIKKFNEC